jgi:hypothetical protein
MRGFLFGIAAVIGIGVTAPAEAHYDDAYRRGYLSYYGNPPLAYYYGRPVRLHSPFRAPCEDFVVGRDGVGRRLARCW